MIMINGTQYGTVKDVAAVFGCTPKTVYRWIAAGKIPRGGTAIRGRMMWRMDRLASILDKGQASEKAYRLCAENAP